MTLSSSGILHLQLRILAIVLFHLRDFFFAEKSYRPHPVGTSMFCPMSLSPSSLVEPSFAPVMSWSDSPSCCSTAPAAVSLHVAGGPMSGMAHKSRVERSRTGEHHALVLVRRLADERRDVLRERFGALEHALHAVRFRSAGVPLTGDGMVKHFGAFKLTHEVFHFLTYPNLKYLG